MKKIVYSLIALLFITHPIYAQHLKSGQIDPGTSGANFRISDWIEGQEWSKDDNFYISRVKPKARFTNQYTQINQDLIPWWEWDSEETYKSDADYSHYSKKILNWIPYGFSYSYNELSPFEILPNGIYNSEVFSMWQYISTWGTWSDHFMRMPGNFADVAHKNGVAVATQSTTAYGADMSTNGWGDTYIDLGGTEENRNKVIAYLDYYGIDGIGYNSEFAGGYSAHGVAEIVNLNQAISQHFTQKYVDEMRSFSAENIWYDGVTTAGSPRFDSGVCELTEIFFGSSEDKKASFFLNYNWNANYNNNNKEYLPQTLQYAATTLHRNPFDVYATVNLQGMEPKLTGKGEQNGRWQYIADKAVSIGIWSGHDSNAFWEDRYDQGSTPKQIQHTYQKLLEHWFTNSYYNPIYAIDDNLIINESLINTLDSEFFGMSKMVAAQSTLCWDLTQEAFVSYFNLGNGTYFNWEGKRQHNAEWFNIGIQDYMPTWRWWWSKTPLGRTVNDIPTGLEASLDWNDAWFGGSSLHIVGNEQDCSILHLFKTQFSLRNGDIVTVRYKINQGNAQCTLLLGLGEECNEWNNENIVLDTDNTTFGTWIEKTFVIQDNHELALIALQFENAENIDLNIGEISIKRGSYPTPDVPTIIRSEILSCHSKGLDAKVIFDMNTTPGNKNGHYNIDHNTSFYNIYAQVTYGDGGKQTTMMGSTTSWAAVFFSSPLDLNMAREYGAQLQIGVQAVGIDMTTLSEIVWSDPMDIITDGEYSVYEYNNDISISSAYITDGTTFSVGYTDPLHPAATNWSITGPYHNNKFTTPTTITIANNATEFNATANINSTTVEINSLPYGFYDITVTEADGNERTLTSIIHIYENSLISTPVIQKFIALDTDEATDGISAVSEETASQFYINDYTHNDFIIVDNDGNERNLKDSDTTLPGAGIKIRGNDTLRMHYVANANAAGNVSKAVDLRQQSLSIVAKEVGIEQKSETVTEGSGWEAITTTHSELDFTIAFWIKMSNIDYDAWLLSIRNDKDDWPKSLWGWLWNGLDRNGNLTSMTIRASNDDNYIYNYVNENGNSIFTFEKDVWYHIAYVFSESKIHEIDYYSEYFNAENEFTLYINGRPITTTSTQTPGNIGWTDFDSNATIAVGGIAGKGRFAGFDGVIDNFQLYNKALDENEVIRAMGNINNPNDIDGLVGFWDFENRYDNGYVNAITAYPDARLQHYYISSNGNSLIPPLYETAGYLGLNDNSYSLVPQATYDIKGGVSIQHINNNTPHNFTEIEWAVYTGNHSATIDEDCLYGYADLTFPDPGLNTYKIYTVKLNLNNIVGEDNAEYQYIYVANIEGRIQSDVVGIENSHFIMTPFPNPYEDKFYITPQKEGKYDIRLLNLDGKEIWHRQIDTISGKEIEINAQVPSGTYIVIIAMENEIVASSKVIKK